MSARYGYASRAMFRLRNNAVVKLPDLPSLYMRSGVRLGSKIPYHVSASPKNLVRAPSLSGKEKPNLAYTAFKLDCIHTQGPLEVASTRPSSDIVPINTRDILTVDCRRRSVEQAVENARRLIQTYEEEI